MVCLLRLNRRINRTIVADGVVGPDYPFKGAIGLRLGWFLGSFGWFPLVVGLPMEIFRLALADVALGRLEQRTGVAVGRDLFPIDRVHLEALEILLAEGNLLLLA